ncbi:hypothetical protein HDU91_004735 [Kappamyces sp. JEL0680]|nr:hypothetical protein HDU91_004735 [Kappamyces sp. JEL0680]
MTPKRSHTLSRSWNLTSVLGIASTLMCAWQMNHAAHLQDLVHRQETQIAQLQQIIALATPATLHPANQTASAVHEHAPHSHYNIPLVDGVPVEPDREYFMADFEAVFNVKPLFKVVETAEATAMLDKHDIYSEQYYQDNLDDIKDIIPLCTGYLKNEVYIDSPVDNGKLAVKWESKETGFGLYAKQAFKAGDIVGVYTGVLYAVHDLDEQPDTDYTWDYSSDGHVAGWSFGTDGREQGNYLRFANHVGASSNTKPFTIPYNNRWHQFYMAVRDIAAGEAVTSDYGEAYFEDRPMVL